VSENNTEEIVVDFTNLNEELGMNQLAAQIQRLMNIVMTGTYYPATIKGNPMQIDRFSRAMAAERDYVVAYNKYGLNNPRTYRNRYKLDSAVRKFEKDTGIVWPFK